MAGRVLVVGDSLGVGTTPYLQRRLGGRVRGNSRVGRPSSEGVEVLRRALRPRDRAVVFDVGTNDASVGELRRSVRQARRVAGGRPLYMATVHGPDAARKNRFLRRAAAKGNIELVPWAARSGGRLAGDGIHATPQGYRARSGLYARALRRGGPVASTAGRPRRRSGPVDLRGYDAEQDRIINAIFRVGRRVGATRREMLAALETGAVESNFRNPTEAESDQDSAGWRQERSHYGPESVRRNPGKAARRFFEETRGLRGQRLTPGQLAQAVQRSAYPDRYAGRREEALNLLKVYRSGAGGGRGGGGGPAGGGSRGGGPLRVTDPSVSRGSVEPGGAGLTAILQALRERDRPQPVAGTLAAPGFAAGPALPKGYRPPESAGGPAPESDNLDALLERVGALEGQAPPRSTVRPGKVEGGRQTAAGGRSGHAGGGGSGRGGLEARADGWYGSKTLAQGAYEIADDMGLSISSEKRSRKYTSSGNISDHWEGNRRAWAMDIDTPGVDSAELFRAGRRVAKAYGVKFVPNSYESGGTVKAGKRTYRIQILGGSAVEHGDHLHVGFERVI